MLALEFDLDLDLADGQLGGVQFFQSGLDMWGAVQTPHRLIGHSSASAMETTLGMHVRYRHKATGDHHEHRPSQRQSQRS